MVKTERGTRDASLAKSVTVDLALGAGLALGLLAYLAASADPETVALIEGSQSPLTTFLIVAGSLVFYLASGLALTGVLLREPPETGGQIRSRRSRS